MPGLVGEGVVAFTVLSLRAGRSVRVLEVVLVAGGKRGVAAALPHTLGK